MKLIFRICDLVVSWDSFDEKLDNKLSFLSTFDDKKGLKKTMKV